MRSGVRGHGFGNRGWGLGVGDWELGLMGERKDVERNKSPSFGG